MTAEASAAYEFGEFTLIPNERLLLRSEVPVHLPPAEFHILVYLVEHPNTIVRPNDLSAFVTGEHDVKLSANLKYNVMKLRKVLGDDSATPRFIRSVFGTTGYKFICPVRSIDRGSVGSGSNKPSESGTLTVSSNFFVPMFLGEEIYSGKATKPNEGRWAETKTLLTENGTLYALKSGFSIWHLAIKDDFANVTDFAYWRRDLYEAIQRGQHSISLFAKEFLRTHPPGRAFNEFAGVPGYVFSANVADSLPFRNHETIRHALQILACPSTLVIERKDRTRSRGIENLLLQGGVPIRDLVQFGLGDLGFASWDGLSYLRPLIRGLENTIIEYEIATQALWWMARCVADVLLAGDPKKVEAVRNLIPEIRRQYSRLKTIGPNETPAERTMIEAVLKTSRIDHVVGEVLDLDKQRED